MKARRNMMALVGLALVVPASPVWGSALRDPDKMICKRQAETGTRFQRRICYTKSQWDQIEEAHKRAAREMIDRPVIEIRR